MTPLEPPVSDDHHRINLGDHGLSGQIRLQRIPDRIVQLGFLYAGPAEVHHGRHSDTTVQVLPTDIERLTLCGRVKDFLVEEIVYELIFQGTKHSQEYNIVSR